jgi:hypothetical protein
MRHEPAARRTPATMGERRERCVLRTGRLQRIGEGRGSMDRK